MDLQLEDWERMPIKEALKKQDVYWERRVKDEIPDTIIFAEHEPVYTAGASLKNNPEGKQKCFKINISDLPAPIVDIHRGGLVTYQGPGILSVYCILKKEFASILNLIKLLEDAAEATLKTKHCGYINTVRKSKARGLFIGENKKIASVGLQISRGVSRYGLSISLDPDKKYLEPLIPCGLTGIRLTSLAQELGAEKFSQTEKNIIKTVLAIKLVSRLNRFRKETD